MGGLPVRRILITGASGYLGRHLVPVLKKDFRLVGIGRERPAGWSDEWHCLDLLEASVNQEYLARLGCDTLVHLAWGLPHGDYWHDRANLKWLQKSITLVEAFLKAGGRNLHMAGTCAEYDWSARMPLTEYKSPLKPRGLYGKCKNALRAKVVRLCRNCEATLGWYRIFWLYGSDQDERKFIPGLVKALAAGERTRCNCANLWRDYIHVRDAAALIGAAVKASFDGALNVGSGVSVPLGEMAARIARTMNRENLLSLADKEISSDTPLNVQASVSRHKLLSGYGKCSSLEAVIEEIARLNK